MAEPVDINDYVNSLPYDVGTQDAIYDAFYAPNRKDMESRIGSLSIPNNLKHEIWNARVAIEKGQPYDFKTWTSIAGPSQASATAQPPTPQPQPQTQPQIQSANTPNYFGALKRGVYNSVERLAKSAENLSHVLPFNPVTGPSEAVAGAISKIAGQPTPTEMGRGALRSIGASAKQAASEQKSGDSVGEMVAEGAGSAPLDIARYAVAQRLGIPGPAAMALTDALYESDKGFRAAVEAGMKGGITGGAMNRAGKLVNSGPVQKALSTAMTKYPQLNTILQGLAQGGAAGLVGAAATEGQPEGSGLKALISNAILGAGLSATAPKTSVPPSASIKPSTAKPVVGVATTEPTPKSAKASAATFMASERAANKPKAASAPKSASTPKPEVSKPEPPPVPAPYTPLTEERFAPPMASEQAAPPKPAKASAAAFMAGEREANKVASEYKLPQLEEAVRSIQDPAKRDAAMAELRSIIGEPTLEPVAPKPEAPAKSAKASAAAFMARDREAKQTDKEFKLNELESAAKSAATPEGRKQLAQELRGILSVLEGEEIAPSVTVTESAPKVEPVMSELPSTLPSEPTTPAAPPAATTAPPAPQPEVTKPATAPQAAAAAPPPITPQAPAPELIPAAAPIPPPTAVATTQPIVAPVKATLTEVPSKKITYRDSEGMASAYTPDKNELLFKAGDKYYSVIPKKGSIQIIDIMKNPDDPFIEGPMSGSIAETASKLLGLNYEPISTEVPPSASKGNTKAKPSTTKKELKSEAAAPAKPAEPPKTVKPPTSPTKSVTLPKSKDEIRSRLRPIMDNLDKIKDKKLVERIGDLSDEWHESTTPQKGLTLSLLEAIEQAESAMGKKK